jgi:hypothetical protein
MGLADADFADEEQDGVFDSNEDSGSEMRSGSAVRCGSDITGRKSNGGVVEPDTVLLRHNLRQGNGKNLRAAAT